MTRLTIELDAELVGRLDELAAAERTSPQELAREALRLFVASHPPSPTVTDDDPYAPLRAMIGLGTAGRPDSSIRHDHRPGEGE